MKKFSETYYSWSGAASRAKVLTDLGWIISIHREKVEGSTSLVWKLEATR
ncbi:hypothetical protein Epa17_00142 [Pseudomonas phage Epa17]|uniref:Uncharacterized protein n=4 Tax=Nankokuvirus G1 TaxID=2560662 RepID=A0A6G9LGV6_9CAUD|nr:hypothetical protein Epa24_00015 [Pseudomonas phage Epa24]QIQ64219.1 hypothetical protein Epa17_00142 [Pseudomonas phage Epa17]QIQ65111.1 hypothetical protein 16_00061 [Pseudomonas phage Epa16]QIQ65747.1 hypothetical protein 26_00156 [Pseudomonas phage Epa26]WKW89011.1 hypothetical protein LSL4_gp160 [Pseudomonas phage LSL4]